MSEITKPIVLNETVQTLNSKIDTTNGYLQRIAAGVSPNLVTKTVTDNGTYDASSDEADGYSSVTVAVPEKTLTTKSITQNGTYNASSDSADGYSSVTVSVSGGQSTLITKNITDNGTYNASSDSADGYSSVTVDLPLGTKSITENGTYNASSDSKKGYSSVTVAVPSSATLKTKNITDNGTYLASQDSADGYSSVTVNVAAGNSNMEFSSDYIGKSYDIYALLIKMTIPEGAITTNFSFFTICNNLTFLSFPSTFIGSNTFSSANFYSKEKLIEMIFNNINPPNDAVSSDLIVSNRKRIYVPDAGLSQYNTKFADITQYISPLSDYKKKSVIYNWDFTSQTPLIDTINGVTLIDNNIDFSNHTAEFTNKTNSYLRIPNNIVVYDFTYDWIEFEISIKNITDGVRLFINSSNFGDASDSAIGLMYWSNIWDMWAKGTNPVTGYTSIGDLDNSIVKIRYDYSNVERRIFKQSLYVNDVNVLETKITLIGTDTFDIYTNGISLGSHRNSITGEINSLKITKGYW